MSEQIIDAGEPPCFAQVFDGGDEPDEGTLARLIRDLADAVVICDRDGIIVFWNAAATTLFGWTPVEAGGKTLELIVPPRFWERHVRGFGRVMDTGKTQYGDRLLEVPALHKDGHTISIAFTVTLLRDPAYRLPHGIAAVLRDDTAHRLARQRAADTSASA